MSSTLKWGKIEFGIGISNCLNGLGEDNYDNNDHPSIFYGFKYKINNKGEVYLPNPHLMLKCYVYNGNNAYFNIGIFNLCNINSGDGRNTVIPWAGINFGVYFNMPKK